MAGDVNAAEPPGCVRRVAAAAAVEWLLGETNVDDVVRGDGFLLVRLLLLLLSLSVGLSALRERQRATLSRFGTGVLVAVE